MFGPYERSNPNASQKALRSECSFSDHNATSPKCQKSSKRAARTYFKICEFKNVKRKISQSCDVQYLEQQAVNVDFFFFFVSLSFNTLTFITYLRKLFTVYVQLKHKRTILVFPVKQKLITFTNEEEMTGR